MSKFLPFAKALALARSLGLANQKEWAVWCKEGRRPPNVPTHPDRTYKDGGWQGWSHWLGTGNQKHQKTEFLPYTGARAVALSHRLVSVKAWTAWCRTGARPANVPARPDSAYRGSGWQGWHHWLGTTRVKKPSKFVQFPEALAMAQSLGLGSAKAWGAWCKEGRCPANVPARPDSAYRDAGWRGWGHWLGTGTGKIVGSAPRNIISPAPFAEALAAARALGLASAEEWKARCKEGRCPASVPRRPDLAYKNGGWQGWGHWLGTGNQSGKAKKQQFLPFDGALAVAQSFNLVSLLEWQQWCKEGMCPPNVPSNPQRTYKDGGWQGWGHWLGTGNQATQAKQFLPFDEALAAARTLGVASEAEWHAWCESGARPAILPARPDSAYRDAGWQGWEAWLRAPTGPAVTPAGAAHAGRRPKGKRGPPDPGSSGGAPRTAGAGKRRKR